MSDRRRGRSLELYFVDGTPDGLVTAEMFNWTGHVLMVPRTRLAEAIQRREAGYTGVYLLMGEDEGRARLYIGETEKLSERLKTHAKEKDWWDRAALVTARDDGLNKAHARYLEARLCEIASSLGRSLENGNTPGGAGLSEAQTANMEGFLDELRVVLPALGVGVFQDQGRGSHPITAQTQPEELESPIFAATTRADGELAKARVIRGEFVVLQGSYVTKTHAEYLPKRYSEMRAAMRQSGVLVPSTETDHLEFTQDFAFSSPSAAAELVTGQSRNGPLTWRVDATGQTYKDWEADRLEAVTSEEAA